MPASPASAGPVLRDIHLPPTPPWWPPAPGWWLLATLLLLAVVALAWLWRRQRRLRQRRRQWLGELDRHAQRHARDGDDAALATSLQQLLRRVARIHDGAATQQRGEAWHATLARVPVQPATLAQLVTLESAMYRPRGVFDAAATLAAARAWLHAAARPRAWKRVASEPDHV
ncbi:MAG TPA: DUF4381 family protein [Rhodanobacter sp.]|nr:DUF4381 family protein [Rhodanobacter sp.]